MDDKHIKFLIDYATDMRRDADVARSANTLPMLVSRLVERAEKFEAAAARLRELMDDNEVLRAECNEGRNVLRPGAPNDAHKKYVAAKVATDARAALEPKGTERLARQGEGGGK